MKKTLSSFLVRTLLTGVMSVALAGHAAAATPAQEKAFVDGFKKAVERKDAKALKALFYVKDADPNALEFYSMMIVSDFGSTIKSAALLDLTTEEKAQMEKGGQNLEGKPIKMPLKPIKSLVLTTASKSPDMTTSGSSQWYIAEFEGKLVIPVPALVK